MITKNILLATLFCMSAYGMDVDSEAEPESKRQKSGQLDPILSQLDDLYSVSPSFGIPLGEDILHDGFTQELLISSSNEPLENIEAVEDEELNNSESSETVSESSNEPKLQEILPVLDKAGNTPLHLAAWKGNLEECRTLLMQGASANARNNEGSTPLHCAAVCWKNVCTLLLNNGAAVDAVDTFGNTPLLICVFSDRYPPHVRATGEVLVNHGANGLRANAQGLTVLDLVTRNGDSRLCFLILQQIVEKESRWSGFEAFNADRFNQLNISKDALFAALSFAGLQGNDKFADLLLRAGADPNYQTSENLSLLCRAAYNHNVPACLYFYNNGTDLWTRTSANKNREVSLQLVGSYALPLPRCTALHILLKHNCLDTFMKQLLATSKKTKINVAHKFVDAPTILLTIFPAIDKRIKAGNFDNNLIPVPELEGTWDIVDTIKTILFEYGLIYALHEKDTQTKQMHKKSKNDVKDLRDSLRKQLHDAICRYDIFKILALKKAFEKLEAYFLVEVADLAVNTKEAEGQAPEIALSSVLDTEETMMISLAGNNTIEAPRSYCEFSTTLLNISQEVDLQQHSIKLPDIDTETWNLIKEQQETLYQMARIYKQESMSLQKKQDALTPLTVQLMNAINGIPLATLKKLLETANYLDIKPLLDCTIELYARYCSLECFKKSFAQQAELDIDTIMNVNLGRSKRGGEEPKAVVAKFLACFTRDIRELIIKKLHPEIQSSIKLS